MKRVHRSTCSNSIIFTVFITQEYSEDEYDKGGCGRPKQPSLRLIDVEGLEDGTLKGVDSKGVETGAEGGQTWFNSARSNASSVRTCYCGSTEQYIFIYQLL